MGHYFFPKIAREFHQQYPDVHLELVERGAKTVGTLVENGNVDMGIVVLPTDERKFSVQPFVEDQFYVFINELHPLAQFKEIQLQDLKK
ncbi:LysR substrate-binding domain-containing protein [Lysinibacillus sp. MHQ-1]|nr:LysR substrate-binding domain-containing protein [Lysinibacillus sp. MHQ-1]